ncbi:hypothetical protein [Desulfoscipio gibsoniae]|uniref:Uncharacterized protein n=1 Tax=Desulfoscipio gibsoniae DSM 7213 TaxID=767817 RepID=R4KRG7_9FIRM|nr:hypothetical protein [Desulfoscipio gibsoniae]AGL03165.1 hypothetical protein Desgi_3855 [Desulfoscipio gibsoniae DSM 7213]
MSKFRDIIICSGVTLFFTGAIGLAFNIFSPDSNALVFIAVISLLTIGAGIFLKSLFESL